MMTIKGTKRSLDESIINNNIKGYVVDHPHQTSKDLDGSSFGSVTGSATTTTTTNSSSDDDDDDDQQQQQQHWKVVRLAATDKERRKKYNNGGISKCPQRKVSCQSLEIQKDGVIGTVIPNKNWWAAFYSCSSSNKPNNKNASITIRDYNHYRTQGHTGKFEPGTNDRAVSIATVAAYDELQKSLPSNVTIQKGDLGENILLDGPPARAARATPSDNNEDDGSLYVGAKIRIGTSTILEITEANNPCYRFNTQKWATVAKKVWGSTAPNGNVDKWFKSPQCPLNDKINPGLRGWLAKVVQEGTVESNDTAMLVRTTTTSKVLVPSKSDAQEDTTLPSSSPVAATVPPPPSKKQRTNLYPPSRD